MLRTPIMFRLFLGLAVVFAGFVFGPLLADGVELAFSPHTVAAAVPLQADPAAPDALHAVHVCNIRNVGLFVTRVHVGCWNAATGNIIYFAVPTSLPDIANRALSLFLTAEAAGKQVEIVFDPAANGSAYGCDPANCRPIQHVLMLD